MAANPKLINQTGNWIHRKKIQEKIKPWIFFRKKTEVPRSIFLAASASASALEAALKFLKILTGKFYPKFQLGNKKTLLQ